MSMKSPQSPTPRAIDAGFGVMKFTRKALPDENLGDTIVCDSVVVK